MGTSYRAFFIFLALLTNWKLTVKLYGTVFIVATVCAYVFFIVGNWYFDRKDREYQACLRRIAVLEAENAEHS